MSASGRKQTFDFVEFGVFERPLSGKADIQILAINNPLLSVGFTADSCRSSIIGLRGR